MVGCGVVRLSALCCGIGERGKVGGKGCGNTGSVRIVGRRLDERADSKVTESTSVVYILIKSAGRLYVCKFSVENWGNVDEDGGETGGGREVRNWMSLSADDG